MEIKGNPLGMALLMTGILIFFVVVWWSDRQADRRRARHPRHRSRPAH